jgi:hypothetical protein
MWDAINMNIGSDNNNALAIAAPKSSKRRAQVSHVTAQGGAEASNANFARKNLVFAISPKFRYTIFFFCHMLQTH